MATRLAPNRDKTSTKYADRKFYAGRWRTPEQIEDMRRWRRESYARHAPARMPKPRGYHRDKDGYTVVTAPMSPNANAKGQVPLHRLVMAHYLGRALTTEERVHHVNENKRDNRIENLWLWPNHSAHCAWHAQLNNGHELQVTMPAIPITKATVLT